jgi:predicted KAP-like P-loop ATPase
MKKETLPDIKDDLRPEYDLTTLLKGGVRGKYAGRYQGGGNLVLIAPDVARAFPTEQSVNEALRAIKRRERTVAEPSSPESLLSSDKPLSDPTADRFEHASFAKTLAESVATMSPPDGLTISICGTWGSGKSTVLNFFAHYLSQLPQAERPIVVRFNPWWFAGQEDLARRFFDQLNAVLGEREAGNEDLIKLIGTFADAISETPLPFASTGKVIAQATKLISSRTTDVTQIKEKISDALRKQKRRIVAIIDDIDRLAADEIRHLFRLVKAVGDFANVVYVLSFDKKVVVKALEGLQGPSGEEYLEKIVQVPFELPIPDKQSVRLVLFEKLSAVLGEINEEDFDKTYWGNVYLEGIDHFIDTPRDVVRLINTLSVIYPSVKGEVNTIDLVALESLRLFCPLVYDVIRKNPTEFTGHVGGYGHTGIYGSDIKRFHEEWINQVPEPDREPIKKLLRRVFPKLQSVWGNTNYGSDWEADWRKQRRLCSAEKFPIYFRLAVPQGDLSDAEMRSIIQSDTEVKSFEEKLVKLSKEKRPDGRTRVSVFLERLEDYTSSEIRSDSIPSIVQALLNVGDTLLIVDDERQGMFDFGNRMRIGRIIWQLLKRLERSERFELLKTAITQARSISITKSEVVVLAQQHGKYGGEGATPENERILSEEQVPVLERIVLDKVRSAAEQGTLLETPSLASVLHAWRGWAGEEEPRSWVEHIIEDEHSLVKLLTAFLNKSFAHTFGDTVGRTAYRLDPKSLEPFLQPSQIIDRIRSIVQTNSLDDKGQIALKQFIKEFDVREHGGDPNDF